MLNLKTYTYESRYKLEPLANKASTKSNQLINLKLSSMEVITIESKAFLEMKGMLETIIQSIQKSKTVSTQEEWMTGSEVMGVLNITSRTLQTYRDTGLLGFTQIGRKKIFYKKADVQQLLNDKYLKPFKHGK
jgi:MerR family transcriptional regulator, repressor of the yfmOP operon